MPARPAVRRHLTLALALAAGGIGSGAATPVAAGEVYKFRDKDGVVHVTSNPADRRKAVGAVQTIRVPNAAPARVTVAPETPVATRPSGAASGVTGNAIATNPPAAAPEPAPARTRTVVTTMYVVRRANGVVEYTNVRPAGRYERSFAVVTGGLAADPDSRIDWNSVGLNLTAYAAEIAAATARHGVDPALVRAIMHAESAFQRNALSPKGAQGLMQLMPATAGDYGVTDAFDPVQNIDAGVEHLAMLLDLYDGDVTLAAAAYNAGQGAVARYGRQVPPFAETQVYVQRVNTLHQRYRSEMALAANPATPTSPTTGASQ
jgi:soluble lytic murein transglycosylase-like protein